MTKTIAIFAVLISLLMMSLSGCGSVPVQEEPAPAQVETPEKGGVLKIGSTLPIRTLDPVVAGEGNGELSNFLFNGLVKVDRNLAYSPDLAESWQVSENGLEWTMKLRSDARWHDGLPVTADDVVFTIDRAIDPRTASPWAPELSNIASYKAVDESTVVFDLYQPDAAFLYTMRIKIIPKHVFESQDNQSFDFNSNPVGTGPFKFQSWDRSTGTIRLAANDEYFGKPPYISGIEFKILKSEEERENAFKNGQIDLIPISFENWSMYQEMKDVTTYEFPSLKYEFIAMNLGQMPFAQKIVRQALMYGIQREKILNEVILGRGHLVNGPIPTNSWAFNSDIDDYKYNPDKAKQLLKEAGWQDTDGDGLLDKNGDKLSFELLVNEENYTRYRVAEQVKQDLSDLGITVKIIAKPWTEVKQLLNSRRYSAAVLGWQLKPDPDVVFAFHSKQIKGGFNFTGYSNPKVDELSAKARRATDMTDRRSKLFEIQKIINDDVPYLFLYSINDLMAVHQKVRGINPGPNGLYSGIENWWIPKEYQEGTNLESSK